LVFALVERVDLVDVFEQPSVAKPVPQPTSRTVMSSSSSSSERGASFRISAFQMKGFTRS